MNNINQPKLWTSSFIFASIANLLTGIAFYQVSVTLPFYILEHFKIDKAEMTYILSSYVLAALFIRFFSGYLVDNFSRKKVYLISFILFVSLFFGYTIISSVAFLFILRMMHGLAWGVITTSSNTLAIDLLPSKRRGEGIGYYGLMSTLAMSIGPICGMYIYDHYDFNYIFYSALLFGVIGILCAFLIKDPQKKVVDEKKNKEPISLDRFILIHAIPLAINVLILEITYGALYTFGVMYGKELNIEGASYLFLSIAVGIGTSRIFSGKLIDKGWINQVNILGISSIGLGYFLIAFPIYDLFYFIGAYFVGLGFGVSIPAFQTQFMNMTFPEKRGSANSTFFIAIDLGIGIGMIAAGSLVIKFGYANLFLIAGFLCLIALIYYIFISRYTYNKHKINI
ncbi:MFS transporter [Faecalibacter rhinopitheci]|uniref:MFS transporter n=1 Tax=Faecalibacter rhinopitheci TaxID=2779678 RepID=A0A8J7G467_9FLAO|nr:MFS transporter [Faecalibacter rhinopitheci]MBF0595940.1 MFS transporter [Faecalibacter rhinopitheci]